MSSAGRPSLCRDLTPLVGYGRPLGQPRKYPEVHLSLRTRGICRWSAVRRPGSRKSIVLPQVSVGRKIGGKRPHTVEEHIAFSSIGNHPVHLSLPADHRWVDTKQRPVTQACGRTHLHRNGPQVERKWPHQQARAPRTFQPSSRSATAWSWNSRKTDVPRLAVADVPFRACPGRTGHRATGSRRRRPT